MSRFLCIYTLILVYVSFVVSIKIAKIPNTRIINSTVTLQADCSSCICQCITFSSLSSNCCYVNCYKDNNTCQVILSPSDITPTIMSDSTSVVYKANCSVSATTTESYTAITNTKTTEYHANLTTIKTSAATSYTIGTTVSTTSGTSTVTYTPPWWCPMCG